MKYKYYLNKSTKTLHILNGCLHAEKPLKDSKYSKFFFTEDEAIKSEGRYMRYCKNCFEKI